jgi:Translation machinery associated TMA7
MPSRLIKELLVAPFFYPMNREGGKKKPLKHAKKDKRTLGEEDVEFRAQERERQKETKKFIEALQKGKKK